MVDVLRVVSSLEPGQAVEFDTREFERLPGWDFLSRSIESKCDRILENVVGSGYGWWYEISPVNQNRVTFKRRKTPLRDGERTYVSPDRRDHYRELRQGLYMLPALLPAEERSMGKNPELEAFARFVLAQPDSECGPLIQNKASDILKLPPKGYCPHGYKRAELADGTTSCSACDSQSDASAER